jgi:hypothetical protein
VAELSARATAIPAGSLLTLWEIRIYWSDGSLALGVAEEEADAEVAAA